MTARTPDLPRTALAVLLFLVAWGVIHVGFYERDQIVDTPVYESYGEAMEAGQVPYRDFAIEYPPGALPVFRRPCARGLGLPRRLRVADGALRLRRGRRGRARGTTSRLRLRNARVRRALSARDRVGDPDALRPLAGDAPVLRARRARARPVAARSRPARRSDRGEAVSRSSCFRSPSRTSGGDAAGERGSSARRSRSGSRSSPTCRSRSSLPEGVVRSVGRQLSRPLQIESLGSAILLAAHDLFGTGVEVGSSHGSQNLVGTSPDVSRRRALGRPDRGARVALAPVCALEGAAFARERSRSMPQRS